MMTIYFGYILHSKTIIQTQNSGHFTVFSQSMNSGYTQRGSNSKKMDHLHNIFNSRQIVKHYHDVRHPHVFEEDRKLKPVEKNFHEQQDRHSFRPRSHKFVEDEFFEELHSAQIVENYDNFMVDERDQSQGEARNAFAGRGEKPVYVNENMLASSSDNNEVPSRNSSLSSLSEKGHFLNINPSDYGLGLEVEKPDYLKHSSSFSAKKSSARNSFKSDNEMMDVENEEVENFVLPPATIKKSSHHYKTSSHISYQQKHEHPSSKIQFTRNNPLNPQLSAFNYPSTFRRMDIDEQRERKERLSKIEKIQQIGCNCKKTKCLKMYCECFNLQIFCNENCNCYGCCNQKDNEEHQQAVLDALTRNPKAFQESKQKLEPTFELGIELNEVKKGCKCKKTKCKKKYCECFNLGQPCGIFCKCEGCENC